MNGDYMEEIEGNPKDSLSDWRTPSREHIAVASAYPYQRER